MGTVGGGLVKIVCVCAVVAILAKLALQVGFVRSREGVFGALLAVMIFAIGAGALRLMHEIGKKVVSGS
jgi:hypothetical protein